MMKSFLSFRVCLQTLSVIFQSEVNPFYVFITQALGILLSEPSTQEIEFSLIGPSFSFLMMNSWTLGFSYY